MARSSWLDEKTSLPILDEKVRELESFTSALADGKVDERELEAQEKRLVTAMRTVEKSLNDEQHAQVTALLVELSAYDIMRTLHELQAERLRRNFS